ncbi:MAG: hypothetical protein KOO63_13265 [Bacteroidales bacterium]|nr:hypothetical protein [Candidatus Latescibacterota bacterium]
MGSKFLVKTAVHAWHAHCGDIPVKDSERNDLRKSFEILIMLAVLAAASPVSGNQQQASDGSIAEVITRASDWYFEGEMTEEKAWRILDRFEYQSGRLDSLLNLFMPLDTISGFKGDERIWQIAESYTEIGMYEEASLWWKILRRNDEGGLFRMENYRGLLRTGVQLADMDLILYLLGNVELWDSSIKTALAPELLDAMVYLYLSDVDVQWLYTRFMRIRRFFPEFDAGIFETRLLIALDRADEAYSRIDALIRKFDMDENSPEQAMAVVELCFTSAVMSKRFSLAAEIITEIGLYGCERLVERVKVWNPMMLMLKKDHEQAASEYSRICDSTPGGPGACFWKEFIVDYRETLADVKR